MNLEKVACRYSGPPLSSIEPEQRQERAAQILDKAVDLPVLSTMALELIRELSQEESSIEKIREIVGSDPVIAARVLRHANSVFYNIPMKIQTIRHAIAMLGLNTIKEIALAFSFQRFVTAKENGQDLESYFLKRNLTLALLAKKISIHLGFSTVGQGEAFLAGLLKDIGVYALLRVDRKCLDDALRLNREQGPFLFVSEERHFGCNHADVGARLALQWKLPDRIRDLIGSQYRPVNGYADTELLAVIQLADAVIDRMEANENEGSSRVLLDASVVSLFKARNGGKPCESILDELTERFGGLCLTPGFSAAIMDDSHQESSKEEEKKPGPVHKEKPPEPEFDLSNVELQDDLFSDWTIRPRTWALAFILVIVMMIFLQTLIR